MASCVLESHSHSFLKLYRVDVARDSMKAINDSEFHRERAEIVLHDVEIPPRSHFHTGCVPRCTPFYDASIGTPFYVAGGSIVVSCNSDIIRADLESGLLVLHNDTSTSFSGELTLSVSFVAERRRE